MGQLELYSYFRSSASFRVRAALNLKKLPFTYHAIHLLKDGGEQHSARFRKLNPLGEVPCLVDGDFALGQSMAILQYLDDVQPSPRLFPTAAKERARVIQLCEIVNSGIHPIQNLKVLQELEKRFGVDQAGKEDWARLWIGQGFTALERLLQNSAETYCFGRSVTAADLYLVPQVYNARRFKLDLTPFPTITAIDTNCMKLEAFRLAEPHGQPDSV